MKPLYAPIYLVAIGVIFGATSIGLIQGFAYALGFVSVCAIVAGVVIAAAIGGDD